MKMIATRAMRYGGVNVDEGEEFEASGRDARTLAAVRRASLVAEDAKPAKAAKAVKAEEPDADDAKAKKAAAKKVPAVKTAAAKATYARRDMRAED